MIGMGLLQYDTIPQWISEISLLPIWISPLLGIIGIIHGVIKIKEKRSGLGIVLSAMCLVENFVILYGAIYLASRY